jgi:hypothetical protein
MLSSQQIRDCILEEELCGYPNDVTDYFEERVWLSDSLD